MPRGEDAGRRTGVPSGRDGTLRPAVFLDRDGTLIQEKDYLADPDGVVLLPGAVEALRLLRDAGLALVVVTNQSGIARGFYGMEEYHAVARRLEELLEAQGIPLDATYFCPHHPDASGPCDCRKPSPGLFRAAARHLGLDLSRSYFVGDRIRDVLPALELGGTGILVRTGYGKEEELVLEEGDVVDSRSVEGVREGGGLGGTLRVEDDLLAAARWVAERC